MHHPLTRGVETGTECYFGAGVGPSVRHTNEDMCGGTERVADMRMHPLIVATRAARAESMALRLEFTIILIRASNTLSQSHEQQARDCGRELDYEINGRAKWGCERGSIRKA